MQTNENRNLIIKSNENKNLIIKSRTIRLAH